MLFRFILTKIVYLYRKKPYHINTVVQIIAATLPFYKRAPFLTFFCCVLSPLKKAFLATTKKLPKKVHFGSIFAKRYPFLERHLAGYLQIYGVTPLFSISHRVPIDLHPFSGHLAGYILIYIPFLDISHWTPRDSNESRDVRQKVAALFSKFFGVVTMVQMILDCIFNVMHSKCEILFSIQQNIYYPSIF